MTPQVRAWVEQMVEKYQPEAPVLELGSLNVNGEIRDLFPEPYTGMDLVAGDGVDEVDDILTARGMNGQYATAVTVETLEHVTEPWAAVDKLALALGEGGLLFVAVPWSWTMHSHPVDCWRILPDGMRHLFARSGFEALEIANDDGHTYAVGRREPRRETPWP
jgi:hypothetical protein